MKSKENAVLRWRNDLFIVDGAVSETGTYGQTQLCIWHNENIGR